MALDIMELWIMVVAGGIWSAGNSATTPLQRHRPRHSWAMLGIRVAGIGKYLKDKKSCG
jgi:hypothetical protein